MEKGIFEKGYKTALLIAGVTALLAFVKGVVGYFTNSLILVTDAFHSASDVVTLFIAAIGIKIASKSPDEKFPYGYYKAENLATLFISALIIFAGYELAFGGYKKLHEVVVIEEPYLAIFAAILSIIVSYTAYLHLCRIGRKNKIQSLVATAHERKMDMFSSIFVLIGIILSIYEIKYIEGIFTIGIAILIFKVGFENMKDAIFALMDFSPKEAKKKIVKILENENEIEGFNGIKLRKSGPFLFGEVEVYIKKGFDISRAHEITEKIGDKIKNEIKEIISFIIHAEPYKGKYEKVALPLNSSISEHFGRAEKFLILKIDKEKREVLEKKIIKNPFKNRKTRAGLACAKFLISNHINALITKEIGEIAFHRLRDEGIEIFLAEGDVDLLIKKFIEGKVKKLNKPTKMKE